MNKIKTYIFTFSIIAFALICVCILYAYTEARGIRHKSISFFHKDLPASFVGKKIAFISDIHTNRYFTGEDVAELVKKVNKIHPDIIILGGDYTDKDSIYLQAFINEISKLNSKHGVYSVLGNHDHWEDAEQIQEGLINSGFHICDNRSYWIKEGNDSIKIGGVGDLWEDAQIIENTTTGVKKSDFCILVSHNPDYMEMLETDLIDLMLSGHTHGGQITLFGLWAPIMPSFMHPEYIQTGQKYRYGWSEKGDTKLYVSSGVGMGTFPLRFFAPPEIIEITLHR